MTDPVSAQGTLVAVSIDPNWPPSSPQGGPLSWVTIAELGDITPPELKRKAIDTTTMNQQDDRSIVSIRRRGEMTLKLNWIPTDPTMDAQAAGLLYKWNQGTRDIYRITFVDGTTWIFSGFITSCKGMAKVDDKLTMDVSIKPTGALAFSA